MTGYGMTKHHLTHKEPGWRYKLAINLSAGVVSTIVVACGAIAGVFLPARRKATTPPIPDA